eukprot:Pgem_evm1s12833
MAWYNNHLGHGEMGRAIHLLDNTSPATKFNPHDVSLNNISYTGYAYGINRCPLAWH